jgi:hypothetical protein
VKVMLLRHRPMRRHTSNHKIIEHTSSSIPYHHTHGVLMKWFTIERAARHTFLSEE